MPGMNSCVKIRRLARASVTDIMVKLRTFFNWAQIHDLVPENPLAHETSSAQQNVHSDERTRRND